MKITHIDIEFVENLKDDYCDYKEYERASLEKLLSRVKESDRQKARELLNDSLNNGIIRLSTGDIEDCFSEASEIEYLEFSFEKLAEQTARDVSPFIWNGSFSLTSSTASVTQRCALFRLIILPIVALEIFESLCFISSL